MTSSKIGFVAAYPGTANVAPDPKRPNLTEKVASGIKLGARGEGFPVDGDAMALLQFCCLLAKKHKVGLNKWSFWIDGLEADAHQQIPLDAVLKLVPKIEKNELQIALLMTKRGPKLRITSDLNSNGRKSLTSDFMDLMAQMK